LVERRDETALAAYLLHHPVKRHAIHPHRVQASLATGTSKRAKVFCFFFSKKKAVFFEKKKQKLLLFWIRANVAASGGLRGADLIL